MEGYPVLIMDLDDPLHKMHIAVMDETSVPDQLNGENGQHIYHVRMLTEMILRHLTEEKKTLQLTQEQICMIATASSLHDVGKSQIPAGILDHPGQLSTVEYDIVKKHTVFGAKLIEQAEGQGLDAEMIRYAAQIALCHHERCDGTGYPQGLTGQQVPVIAQTVALADTYDALTRKRRYKQAYSSDVAIQMISSGMCGAFPEELVDSLIHVVEHQAMNAMRQRIEQRRAVIDQHNEFIPQRVLCLGNTTYITEEFLTSTFPESQVVVVGNPLLESRGKIKSYKGKDSSIRSLFHTYEFDAVVYFSRELRYHSQAPSDARLLQELLRQAAATKKDIKIVYLSAINGTLPSGDGEPILTQAKEQLCAHYADSSALDIRILQIPCLYSGTDPDDLLYGVFSELHKNNGIELDACAEDPLNYLSMTDLSSLLSRLFDNWQNGGGILTVAGDFSLTFADFAKELKRLYHCDVTFTGTDPVQPVSISNKSLRNHYGWFAQVSVLEELPEQYRRYLSSVQKKENGFWDRLKGKIKKHSRLFKTLELLMLFVLTEGLMYLTDSTVIYSIVDFRMAFIVIIAANYGLSYGLAASLLSSIAWLFFRVSSGANLMTIFYEPTNWLAFGYYFLIGGLCGYVKLHREEQLRQSREDVQQLEEKLIFTRQIYEETYLERRELKKQILGSKDSFGKIFDITQKLDTVDLQQLYLRTVEAMENILENHSVAIYSVNEQNVFGRLEAASRESMEFVTRSISLDHFEPVICGVSQGNVWRNTKLEPDLPMYAAGVYENGKLALLIFLWRAEMTQQTLYYANLLKILKDLVQMSLLRALQYHRAVRAEQYVSGTGIMNRNAFESLLCNFRELSQRKMSDFLLLKVGLHGQSLEQADRILSGKIRQNDVLGLGQDGQIYVLLSQATEKSLEIILPRFEGLDMDITVVSQ